MVKSGESMTHEEMLEDSTNAVSLTDTPSVSDDDPEVQTADALQSKSAGPCGLMIGQRISMLRFLRLT